MIGGHSGNTRAPERSTPIHGKIPNFVIQTLLKMRNLPLGVLLVSLALPIAAHAQSLHDLLNAAGAKGKAPVQEDNTPFKPLGFTGSYRWEIHTYKNGTEEKDSPGSISMAFDDAHMALLPHTDKKEGEMRMVFDLKDKYTYTLVTDKKGERTGIKMKARPVHAEDDSTSMAGRDTKVARTEETKLVEGHNCRKYTYSNEDGTGEAWIAEDIPFNAFEALANMMGSRSSKWQQAPYHGMVMENTWNAKNGKEQVKMYTRDLVLGKVDPALFSTDGYAIQDMTSMPVFGQ